MIKSVQSNPGNFSLVPVLLNNVLARHLIRCPLTVHIITLSLNVSIEVGQYLLILRFSVLRICRIEVHLNWV